MKLKEINMILFLCGWAHQYSSCRQAAHLCSPGRQSTPVHLQRANSTEMGNESYSLTYLRIIWHIAYIYVYIYMLYLHNKQNLNTTWLLKMKTLCCERRWTFLSSCTECIVILTYTNDHQCMTSLIRKRGQTCLIYWIICLRSVEVGRMLQEPMSFSSSCYWQLSASHLCAWKDKQNEAS